MSKTETKKRGRTKLVWYKNTTVWENFPLVILAKEIEKQAWFTGKIYTCGHLTLDEAKKRLLQGSGFEPNDLRLIQQYKSYEMKVYIEWIFQETRCNIQLKNPHSMYIYSQNKITKSKYIEGVLERIQQAFEEGMSLVEKMISKKKEEEAAAKIAKEYHKNLCERLGVEVIPNKYMVYNFTYGMNRKFQMQFQKDSKDGSTEEVFNINNIRGSFGIEEIKQLIKVIGGSPRAITSRLTNTK